MGSKKQIIAIVLLTVLLGGGAVGYSWQAGQARASTFPGAGYVHIADPEQEAKQLSFQSGTAWRKGLSDTVTFVDAQGVAQKVSAESFTHYENRSLSALSRGVVVDLNDLDTAQVTNHYAVAPSVTFASTGNGYTLENSATELTLSDFLWKISEDKYMLVSQDISLHFSDEDVREASDYVEITYVDEGVIQLQTSDNVWQTVSDECYATLDSGERVDLSLRNVQDSAGDVLMDFSKMVVDADSNIEVTPLTEELENVKESVIPHFEITAEDGKDGEIGGDGAPGQAGAPGEAGLNGESGEDGQQGEPGTAGANGAAGASGTNGAAGNPGAPGKAGENGEKPQGIDSQVLNFPEIILENWAITADGCSGTFKVKDEGGMLIKDAAESNLITRVEIVDAVTGQTVVNGQGVSVVIPTDGGDMDFTRTDAKTTGITFKADGLKPDREYLLVVDAPINTRVASSQEYVRNFITKTFYTDSVGLLLEAGPSTIEKEEKTDGTKTEYPTVSMSVSKQAYSSENISNVMVYLYESEAAAAAATAENPGAGIAIGEAPVELGQTVTFSQKEHTGGAALEFNRTYYARVRATVGADSKNMMPAQILTLTTLKRQAVVRTPMLTSNRTNYGFDLLWGGVEDPDNGVVSYRYEFYEAGSDTDGNVVPKGNSPVKVIETRSTSDQMVPLDNNAGGLAPDTSYIARMVAIFNDNEKTYEIASDWSNPALVTGSQLPIVRFYNKAQPVEGGDETPDRSDISSFYDQLVGEVAVLPGSSGSVLLLGNGHVPRVTIRASGYYYVQYPVYPKGEPLPADAVPGKYLLGTVADTATGEVRIEIPEESLPALKSGAGTDTDSGTVDGLKDGTAYRIIVTGDLANKPGVEPGDADKNVTVGACVVNTPRLEAVPAVLTYNTSGGGGAAPEKLRGSTLRLFAGGEGETMDDGLTRQKGTLTTLTIEALTLQTSTRPEATVILSENLEDRAKGYYYKDVLVRAKAYSREEDVPDSLGEVAAEGIPLTTDFFRTNNSSFNASSRSALFVRVGGVLDYTYLEKNRENQYDAEEDPNSPESQGKPVTSYKTNQFTLFNNENAKVEGNQTRAEMVSGGSGGVALMYRVPLQAAPDAVPEPEEGLVVEAALTDLDKNQRVDDAYLLTAQYANGGKLARYITYYVFDYFDFHTEAKDRDEVVDSGLTYDKDSFPGAEDGFDAPNNVGYKPLTPVTTTKNGAGSWLAKIRVQVPTGSSVDSSVRDKIPQVIFVPQKYSEFQADYGQGQTAVNLQFDSVNRNIEFTQYEAQKAELSHPGTNFVAADNTWYLFYPEDAAGSDAEKNGHQFVFVWTLEYEMDGKTKYYPFEFDYPTTEADDATYGVFGYKKIPHSGAWCAPRTAPLVYAKPWSTYPLQDKEGLNETQAAAATALEHQVTWKVWIADKDGAVVPNGNKKVPGDSNSEDMATLNKLSANDTVGTEIQNSDSSYVEATIHRKLPRELTLAADGRTYLSPDPNDTPDEVTITQVTYTSTGKTENPVRVGLEVQLYNENYVNKNETDNTWTYKEQAKTNHRKAWNRALDSYARAFVFNRDVSGFLTKEQKAKIGDVKVKIEEKLEGSTVNQFDVTVTGDSEVLKKANGVRLTFAVDGKTPITLDKYILQSIDKNGDWITWGGTDNQTIQSLRFRVHISRELSDIANRQATVTAQLLYETGEEGFQYAADDVDASLVYYGSTDMTDGSRQWARYEGSGSGSPSLRYSVQDLPGTVEPLRLGSFFNLVPIKPEAAGSAPYEWPSSMTVKSTREALWNSHGWHAAPVALNFLTSDVSVATYVPRKLAGEAVKVDATDVDTNKEGVQITIPSVIPVITYVEDKRQSFSNYIGIDYSISGYPVGTQSTKNKVYFSVQKRVLNETTGQNEYMLMKPTMSGTVQEWTSPVSGRPVDGAAINYVQNLTLDSAGGVLYRQTYDADGDPVSLNMSILEPNTWYQFIAWYWDETAGEADPSTGKPKGAFRMLNMENASGELGPNQVQINTLGTPVPRMNAGYGVSGYEKKYIWMDAGVSNVTAWYYVIELQEQDGSGNWRPLAYVDWDSSRRTETRKARRCVTVGSVETDFEGTAPAESIGMLYARKSPLKDNFELRNPGGSSEYPVLREHTGSDTRLYLNYGETYRLQMKLFPIGQGPAYTGTEVGNQLIDSAGNPIAGSYCTVRVNGDDDTMVTNGSLHLKQAGEQTEAEVQWVMGLSAKSYRLRHGRIAAVVLRQRTEQVIGSDGKPTSRTTYTDVTKRAKVSNSADDFDLSIYAFVWHNGNITIPVGGADTGDVVGDVFHLFLFGVDDSLSQTTKPVSGDMPDRNYILAGRRVDGAPNMFERLITLTDGSVSRRLSYHKVVYTGNETSAGQVSLIRDEDRVAMSMISPIRREEIARLVWTITGNYSLSGDNPVNDSETVNGEINLANDKNKLFYTIEPRFTEFNYQQPNLESLYYTVTVEFFDKDNKPVVLNAADPSANVGSNNTRLTQTITIKGEEPEQIISTRSGLSRLAALLPDFLRKWVF